MISALLSKTIMQCGLPRMLAFVIRIGILNDNTINMGWFYS
jgi:hypothetical protein